MISRDRGTTFADGATRGAPQALQVADRWHIIHHVGEALEKVLARHHVDVKRAFASEEEQQVIATLDQQAKNHIMVRSQAEQLRQARRERRFATYRRVRELSIQGWSGASIARMLGIHKKTAVKYAAPRTNFPKHAAIKGTKSLLTSHFSTRNGLLENTIPHSSIKLFVLKDTLVQKRLYAITSRSTVSTSDLRNDSNALILQSLRRADGINVPLFRVVVRSG